MSTVKGTSILSRQPKVRVAAFGKHPGWDDHIEDIGMESDRMVWVRRLLYTEGVAGNIDSGAWEKLEEEKRLPAFQHQFFWRVPEGLVIGRFWSSRDGKGRTKYPMCVCALVEGVAESWAAEQIPAKLELLEKKVKETNSAEIVRLAVGTMRREIEDAAALVMGGGRADESELLRSLALSPAMDAEGKPGLGLVRVLYEVDRELKEFKGGTGIGRTRMAGSSVKPQHFRVPACLPTAAASARAWMTLVNTEAPGTLPVLAIVPENAGIVDVIVGEPRATELFCCRAATKGLALTTEVPYTIEDSFLKAAGERIGAWKAGTRTPGVIAETDGGGKGGSNKAILIVAGAAAAIAVVVGAALLMSGKKEGGKPGDGGTAAGDAAPSDKPSPAPPREDPAPRVDGGEGKQTPEAPRLPAPSGNGAANAKPSTPETPPKVEPRPATEPAPVADGTADPRTNWEIDRHITEARERLSRLEKELAAESREAPAGIAESLNDAQATARSVRTKPLTDVSRRSIAREVQDITASVAEARATIDRELADSALRVREFLSRRAAAPSVEAEPLKRAWATAMRGIDPSAGWEASKARAEQIEASLKDVEKRIPAPTGIGPGPGSVIDAGKLMGEAQRRHERVLQDAGNAAAGGDGARVATLTSEYSAWLDKARGMMADAAALERALSGPDPLADAGLASAEERVRKSELFGEYGEAVQPLLGRVQAMRAVGSESDPAKLIGTVNAPNATPTEVLTAIKRLSTLAWPADAAQVQQASDLLAGPVARAVGATPEGERAARQEEVRELGRAMWARAARTLAKSGEGASVLMATAPGLSVGPEQMEALPQWARYNLSRRRFEAAIGAAGALSGAAKTEAVKAAITTFRAEAAALPAVAGNASVAALLEGLEPYMKPGSDVDVTRLGPGGAGWNARLLNEEGTAVEYTRNAQRLVFSKVGDDSGETVSYLATTEVSVGLFMELITAAGKWDVVKPMLPELPATGVNAQGPRVWEWSTRGGGFTLAAPKGAGDKTAGWLPLLNSMENKDSYPAGLNVPPPSMDSPMQNLPPTAAVVAAKSAGCRLPTIAEWKAALAAAGESLGTPNRRDATWKRQYDHVKSLGVSTVNWPTLGIYRRTVDVQNAADDSEPAVAADDGVLWFRPIGSAAGPVHQDLVGNVSEFVVEEAVSLDGLSDLGDAAIRAALRAAKPRVIGGSALSGKDLAVDEPATISPSKMNESYTDVGFRLAFSAPRGALGGGGRPKLDDLLKANGYLTGE